MNERVGSERMTYSIVMAVYKNDRTDWLKQAIDSVLNQTMKSNDIIIVRDGTVSEDIESVLKEYDAKHKELTVVRLSKNVGAGQARNEGVQNAKNELIAIMDADDISLPNRFELQLAEFGDNPELALVGGQISEFEGAPENIVGYRKVPNDYHAIKKFARYRSPINHVTIMFKKSAFITAGGYPKMNRAEDYYMVSSLIANNYIISNLQTVVVNCRISSENIMRRKTWRNIRENIISRWKIHKLGTISFVNFCISSTAQIALFIMPVGLLAYFIQTILRGRS